jgi:hypothetical protein
MAYCKATPAPSFLLFNFEDCILTGCLVYSTLYIHICLLRNKWLIGYQGVKWIYIRFSSVEWISPSGWWRGVNLHKVFWRGVNFSVWLVAWSESLCRVSWYRKKLCGIIHDMVWISLLWLMAQNRSKYPHSSLNILKNCLHLKYGPTGHYSCSLPPRGVYEIKCTYLASRTHGLFKT